jgi:hypothetical protein
MIRRLHHLRDQKQEQAWLSWTVPNTDFTITNAAVSIRSAPRRPGAPAGPACRGPLSRSGGTWGRGQSEQSSRAIAGAERIASPEATRTAPAAIQTARVGRLCMTLSPVELAPGGISHAFPKPA